MNEHDEPVIYTPVRKLIEDLSGKVDEYHKEVKTEIGKTNERVTKLEFQQKTLRIWGLVALFAGGAGGTLLAGVLGVG